MSIHIVHFIARICTSMIECMFLSFPRRQKRCAVAEGQLAEPRSESTFWPLNSNLLDWEEPTLNERCYVFGALWSCFHAKWLH